MAFSFVYLNVARHADEEYVFNLSNTFYYLLMHLSKSKMMKSCKGRCSYFKFSANFAESHSIHSNSLQRRCGNSLVFLRLENVGFFLINIG